MKGAELLGLVCAVVLPSLLIKSLIPFWLIWSQVNYSSVGIYGEVATSSSTWKLPCVLRVAYTALIVGAVALIPWLLSDSLCVLINALPMYGFSPWCILEVAFFLSQRYLVIIGNGLTPIGPTPKTLMCLGLFTVFYADNLGFCMGYFWILSSW